MVTMKRIAEICGVSRGTVDRALNGRGRVNAETAERIQNVAEQLGYEPNPAGKALSARKKMPVIGVVIPAEGNNFFDDVLNGMKEAETLYAIYGLKINYYTMRGYNVEEQLAMLNSIEDKINALVISPINAPEIAAKINVMVDKGIFIVTVNNDINGTRRHCFVGSDYYNGGVTSCALLAALMQGGANIAIALGSQQVLGHRERLAGFKARMERVNDFKIVGVIENNDDDILAYEMMKELLTKHPEINAVSILAAGVYGTCRAIMQLPVEKRPLVLAFDTVPTTIEMMKNDIIKATIYQHPFRQGRSAINRAFEFLVNGRQPTKDSYVFKNEIKLYENL